MTDITLSKDALRRALLADRQAIPLEVRREWDAAICKRLLEWWEEQRPPVVGAYWPIRSEPDLRCAFFELSSRGVQLALPIVIDKDMPLGFAEWIPGSALVKDAFGVMVPQQSAPLVHPAALLIPCVGFNSDRYRLGYGGGFYDRTLATQPRPLAVGIAYECGRTQFASERFDIALDLILTERS